MQVQILRGSDHIFAVAEADGDPRLLERYGPWAPFKSIELIRGQAQPGVES